MYQITEERKLNYPHSSIIENTFDAIKQKYDEIKIAIDKHRNTYPNYSNKYLVCTTEIENDAKSIHFGYIVISNFEKEDNLLLFDMFRRACRRPDKKTFVMF